MATYQSDGALTWCHRVCLLQLLISNHHRLVIRAPSAQWEHWAEASLGDFPARRALLRRHGPLSTNQLCIDYCSHRFHRGEYRQKNRGSARISLRSHHLRSLAPPRLFFDKSCQFTNVATYRCWSWRRMSSHGPRGGQRECQPRRHLYDHSAQ